MPDPHESPPGGGVQAAAAEVLDLLRRIPLLSELTDEDLEQLLRDSGRIEVSPGELFIREGATDDGMYVVLSGQIEVFHEVNGEAVTLATEGPGSFVGEMALVEEACRSASVRAVRPSELIMISGERFRDLLATSPAVSLTVLRTVIARLRSTENILMERERLAALGTLTGGLAHELNNPAAALPRAAAHLTDLIEAWAERTARVERLDLGEAARARLRELSGVLAEPLEAVDPLLLADAEDALGERLERAGVRDVWDVAPALAAGGWTPADLEELGEVFGGDALPAVLQWLSTGIAIRDLTDEIRQSARAISAVVAAVRMFSRQEQEVEVGPVEIEETIGHAMTLLNHRLKEGVSVVTRLAPDAPSIRGNAADLGQLWTILIENAIDAVGEEGRIEIDVRMDGGVACVEVADNGPGIPPKVARRIFDPFFTTKPPGDGMGLGLAIAHRIARDHGGQIRCRSQSGETIFSVRLPRERDG